MLEKTVLPVQAQRRFRAVVSTDVAAYQRKTRAAHSGIALIAEYVASDAVDA